MKRSQFSGFPEEMFTFLRELASNNNREWFNENKARYQDSVVRPVSEFIVDMAPGLEGVSGRFVADPRPHRGSMFRIYRDTRFAKDKRPYKESVGCHFRHAGGKDAHTLGYYLHLQPDNCRVGAGIWKPEPSDLAKIRSAIAEREQAWRGALHDRNLQARFGTLRGESLKKVPRGYDSDAVFAEDIKRKSYFVSQDLEDGLARSPAIVDAVVQAYADAAPLMKFLAHALDLPY